MDVHSRCRITTFILGLISLVSTVLLLLMSAQSYAISPVLSQPVITNVTDRSFSLIWTSDQSGSPLVEIYSDAAGTVPVVSDISITPYGVFTGNPALDESDRQSSIDSIVAVAKSNGIFEVTVAGLMPATQYFIKHGVQAELTQETTLCPDSAASFCPDANLDLLSLTTELSAERVDASTHLYMNDVLLGLNVNTQQGQLVIINAETAAYPVSAFVGDGVPAPYVVVDLNNFFAVPAHTSLLLTGSSVKNIGDTGEGLVVRYYKGVNGSETSIVAVDVNQKRGALMTPVTRKYGDCNSDGRVNNYDHLLMANVVAGLLQETEYVNAAFHPVFCNLYKEDGLHSIATSVQIDGEDQSRLEALLIGKSNSVNLPEAP